jgi:type IV secretion system protein VirB10
VTENVYDSVTGNYLLIPQGSRLLGKYQSLVTNGQNRALLVWSRLIYPNGKSILLDGMPGTDQIGHAGLVDKVDYHLDKLAEATALTTAIAYAGNLARNRQSSNGYSNQDVVGDTVAQQVNRVGEKVIDRQLDLQPTITIRSGWPLRVLVNKDMILEPYQSAAN